MVVQIMSKADYQKEVLDYDGIVIFDCWAERCAPCRMLIPVLEEISQEFEAEGVKVVKLNVEASAENGQLAQQLWVSSIPALYYFKGGKLVSQSVGAAPKQYFVEKIAELKALPDAQAAA